MVDLGIDLSMVTTSCEGRVITQSLCNPCDCIKNTPSWHKDKKRSPRFLMNLKSCNCHLDGVLFDFYDILINALGFLLLRSVTLLIENKDGGRKELDPPPFRNLNKVDSLAVEV